jgi:uncharacterized DUF497 family protein
VKVEWDEVKNLSNQEKHGVSFGEAQELFLSGADYLEIFDVHHSDHEERFIAIGPIVRGVVMVVFTERDENTIRIISARPATKGEVEKFHRYMEQADD